MKKVLMVAIVTGALLVGCGESDAPASEGGGSRLGSKVEFDVTAKPRFDNNGKQSNQLVIRSRNDEQVKIDAILVNRGNCFLNLGGGFKSGSGGNELDQYMQLMAQAVGIGSGVANKELYILDEDKKKAFFEKHPEYDFIKEGRKLPTKEGKLVECYDSINFNAAGKEYYNNLTKEAQDLYFYKDNRMVLGFGEEATFPIVCSYDGVLEVTIKTDKGEVSYKMGR